MSDHSSAVFNNSCLRIPRNPASKQPLPVYEQKYLNQLKNQATKLRDERNMKSKRSSESELDTIRSLIDFYDSIPEYDDVNHLPSKEFYRRIANLKEKQRLYHERIRNEFKFENRDSEWLEEYKSFNVGHVKLDNVKTSNRSMSPIPTKSQTLAIKSNEDIESVEHSERDITLAPPSRRSVRIETPSDRFSLVDLADTSFRSKSRTNPSSAGSKAVNRPCTPYVSAWDDLSVEDLKLDLDNKGLHSETRSAPNSPSRNKVGWKDTITIPQPFQMTVRDEENKIVEELFVNTKKPKEEKNEMFRAHPVPIESQIPLFDKIMADQERRSNYIKNKRRAELIANMQPFSFTRREEELQSLTRRLSKSSPCIFPDNTPLKVKQFKAKPVPKNLFSNYIYRKMNEDEFYRTLQKKIRAEEMLKAASLPPSMAKREKSKPKYAICPRSVRDLDTDDGIHSLQNVTEYKECYLQEKEFEQLKREFLKTGKQKSKEKGSKKKSRRRFYSAGSRSSDNLITPSSTDLSSINRSNLAAVLRIQSARKRLEMEMMRKLEEVKLKEEARWREKVMRKKPVWESLAYSQEEDLAMRLQLRRDEERLRNEEHRQRMQTMLGRVNQQPTLFERQSQYNHPKLRGEYVCRLHNDYNGDGSPNLSVSSSSGKGSLTEMKDEAIQVILDEDIEKYKRKEGNGNT